MLLKVRKDSWYSPRKSSLLKSFQEIVTVKGAAACPETPFQHCNFRVPEADVMARGLWIQDENGIVQVQCKGYPGKIGNKEKCSSPVYLEE